jgi:hypothetical protein
VGPQNLTGANYSVDVWLPAAYVTNGQLSVQPFLQDSSGRILEDWNGRQLILIPNPKRTDTAWFPYDHNLIRYSFAKDNYIRVLSCTLDTPARLQLVIEDSSAKRTRHYKRMTMPLTSAMLYSLHNNVGRWTLLENNVESPPPQDPFDKLQTIHCTLAD